MTVFLELLLKSLLCGAVAFIALRALQGRSAAHQAMAAHAGLVGLLMVPLGMAALPAWTLDLTGIGVLSGAADRAAAFSGLASYAPGMDWEALEMLLVLGLVVVSLLLLGAFGWSLAQLARLRSRSDVLTEPRWIQALANAQATTGVKHGTALLASEQLASPVSWGVVRPVIAIDRLSSHELDLAVPVIAHELAHVVRRDWLKLLAGRLACALLWFNPLAWMLARRCSRLCESAADDVVLQGGVDPADYARMLVQSAGRTHDGRFASVANAIAPAGGELEARVRGALDADRSRARVHPATACATHLVTAAACLALAGLQFTV